MMTPHKRIGAFVPNPWKKREQKLTFTGIQSITEPIAYTTQTLYHTMGSSPNCR